MKSAATQVAIPGSGLLRFLRVFIAVFVSGLVTAMIASALSGDPGNHPLHNPAPPVFALFFFCLPFALGFSMLLAMGFYLIDRQAFRAKSTFARHLPFLLALPILLFLSCGFATSVELLSGSKPEAPLRSAMRFGGFIALFLALYWLMTGRVAGRAGWSIRHFRRTPWDEKLFLAALVALFLPGIWNTGATTLAGLLPTRLGTPEFHVKFEREMTARMKRALRRFPDAQSCLVPGADASRREDLTRMNWDAIKRNKEAKVCIFRLLHGWGGVAEASDWLTAQGFRVNPGSFSSQNPYVERNGTLRVTGGWSIKKNGPRYPTTGLMRRALASIPYSMSVNATYSTDGNELLFITLDSSTL